MQPLTVLLRKHRRVGGVQAHAEPGFISAVTIGIGGGVGGGLRLGLTYGVMLTIVFGLVVGIPVGAVGAAIRWLSAPVIETFAAAEHTRAAGRRLAPSTLRTDRMVTGAAVIGIGAAAAGGIGA